MGSVMNIIFSVLTAIIGVICLGGGIIGHLLEKTSLHERILLFAAAFLLISPGLLADIAGILCVIVTVVLQLSKRNKTMPHQVSS